MTNQTQKETKLKVTDVVRDLQKLEVGQKIKYSDQFIVTRERDSFKVTTFTPKSQNTHPSMRVQHSPANAVNALAESIVEFFG